MYDFEKLGAFYLGKRADAGSDKISDELVLYDSRDLTTHAVIIGMTGSGKTGLDIGLIEDAPCGRPRDRRSATRCRKAAAGSKLTRWRINIWNDAG